MKSFEKIFFLFTGLFGLFLVVEGWQFKLIRDKIPGPGFLPFFIGLLMILVSVLLLFVLLKRGAEPFELSKEEISSFFTIIGGGIIAGVLTTWLGLLPSLAALACCSAKLLGTKKWKTCIVVAVVLVLALYLIFDLLLGVPLPEGIFKN